MANPQTSQYKPANFRIISIRQSQRMLHVEDCLDIGKIRLDLYDYQRGAGTKTNCDFYINTDTARLIAFELVAPHLETTNGLELQGGSRNGEVTARSFKLEETDTKNPYRITIANGPGVRSDGGLIAFKKGSTPTRIAMLLSRIDAKTVGLALLHHLQAWAAFSYPAIIEAAGLFKPETPADPPTPLLCPTCHTSPCTCTQQETGEVLDSEDPILRYASGQPVSENPAEIQAYQAYITAERAIPPSVEALRDWLTNTPKPRNTRS